MSAYCTVPIVVGILGCAFGWLTTSGSMAGIAVGIAVAKTGVLPATALLAFFVVASVSTKVSRQMRKMDDYASREFVSDTRDSSCRGVLQVSAVGLVPAIMCLSMSSAWWGRHWLADEHIGLSDAPSILIPFPVLDRRFLVAFLGWMACCCGDNLSSEIGILSSTPPVLLTSLRPVPPGTDGAVSLLGVASGLAGGGIIGICMHLSNIVMQQLSSPQSGVAGCSACDVLASVAAFAVLGGVGSVCDSLLGCLLQPSGFIQQHKDLWKPLNSLVNFISSACTATVAVAMDVHPGTLIPLAVLALLMCSLAVSSLHPFWARKILHIGAGGLILTVGTTNPEIIITVSIAVMVAHMPGLELASLWNRFDPHDQTTEADYRRFLASPPPAPRDHGGVAAPRTPDDGIGNNPGIFFYQLATFATFYHCPERAAAVLGPMYFGDPAAAIVGRLLGTTSACFQLRPGDAHALRHAPRQPLPATKTAEGALGFTAASLAWLWLACAMPPLPAAAVAATLAYVELTSGWVDNVMVVAVSAAFAESSIVPVLLGVGISIFYYSIIAPAEQRTVVLQAVKAYWEFLRPHTIIGTLLSIGVMSTVAVFSLPDVSAESGDHGWGHTTVFGAVTVAWFAALHMNVYIVGLNQMFDIPIDLINKPYLPVASGEFPVPYGWALVVTHGCASVLTAWAFGTPALLWTVVVSGTLGTVYSMPGSLMRWKRFPTLAAMCIFVIRGIVVQVGFVEHINQAFVRRHPDVLPPDVLDNEIVVYGAGLCHVSLL
eukprot:m.1052572 g.1052572  ORF g.1052572 m.1052572 type:complete len:771 (-) comp24185_c0_seq26:740-3052(-)